MIEFIMFLAGAFFGIFITAISQANRNAEDRERAEYAVNKANFYKKKCRELQEIVNNEKR